MISTMLVDLDHLLANPMYVPHPMQYPIPSTTRATHDRHARNLMFLPQATTRWNRIDRSHEPRFGRLLHDERRWYVSYEGLC